MTEAAQQPKGELVRVPAKQSLVTKFAMKYSIEPDKLLGILKATAFKQKSNVEVTNEQMAALLVVADQYGLNPFTREIFAFPDKQNGIVPVVGVDGWSRIVNDHEQSDGFEFRQSEEMTTQKGAQECPKWMEVIIYRKDRGHPIIVREYLDEVYRPPSTRDDGSVSKGPWQTHTKRFLRHKVFIQGARIAYGFSGIYDEDEAQRIAEIDVTAQGETLSKEPERSAGAALKQAVAPKLPADLNVAIQAAIDSALKHDNVETLDLWVDGLDPEILRDQRVIDAVAARRVALTEPKEATGQTKKDIGTPKLRKHYVECMASAKNVDALAGYYDETRFYEWTEDDAKALADLYNKRLAELEG